MRKRTVRKSGLQIVICIIFLIMGIVATCVLVFGNPPYDAIPIAVIGILIGIFGFWGILNGINFRIKYDHDEIVIWNFLRKRKTYYFRDLNGYYFENGHEDFILSFKNGSIMLDDLTEGRELLIKIASERYADYHEGKRLPHIAGKDRHTVILVMLVIFAGTLIFYGIISVLPEREEDLYEFSGQIRIAPLHNYDADVCFNMNGNEIHIRDPKIAILNVEKLQKELSVNKEFRLETTKVTKTNWEYYIVRYMEDEDGNVFVSYYSSGKTNMILVLICAAIILAMTLALAIADKKIAKEEHPKIYRLFWRD